MPLNERKIISTILDECNSVEERCDGYKQELVEVIAYIISAEQQNRVRPTTIQQKISDKCHSTGEFLARERAKVNDSGEGF